MCRVKVYLKLINLSFYDKTIKNFINIIINLRKKIYIANVDNCGCGIQRFIQALLGSYLLEIIGGIKIYESTSGPNLVRHPGGMVLWATLLVLHGAGFVGSMTGVPGVPENVTVMFLNPTSVRVSWSTSLVEQIEKYDVTYKPTDARMVRLVAGNSDAVTLNDLQADTQYQLVITAVRAGKKYRSRPIVFRTLEPPRTSPQQDAAVTGGPIPPPPLPPSMPQPPGYIQVRGVEVGIVVMILIVWAGAIALFFNRWGKIRMLLPYQPDYKEQLKVPGTGVCATTSAPCTQHSSQHACSQHLHWSSHRVDSLDSANGGVVGAAGGTGSMAWSRSSRPRINSAIDVAGFLSQEFLRRHGSTSRLCRKVRSADNLPLASSSSNNQDNEHMRSLQDESTDNIDKIEFLQTNRDEQESFDDIELSKRQSSTESKDQADVSLIEVCPQQSTSRDCSSSLNKNIPLISKRFPGWKFGGSHEYVRCPIRQPTSIDERFHRRSCEPDFSSRQPQTQASIPPLQHHHHHHQQHHVSPIQHLLHHRSIDNNNARRHSRSCEYSKRADTINNDSQHFGLPILSISEPSPPDERDRLDDYL
ncbi:hypothetical protein HCN44_007300 [Aphidius gifuensis]|uniref:Fibronectin type-III domain-containing protein n=1 Tax=Aphidius gifuensis TaxID=684658 RepID=A0A834XPC9_APHGI|nr:uncharacterized protein LOC122857143 isoform X2 [Aphidius gifuensis]XP_044015096.1 uncharacterized protein LOC122857143 isoform X2 [Aphidius gifuensis]KAF7988990.1 hypothetical protein HCN44_007300 [Aphidius gifuensis]